MSAPRVLVYVQHLLGSGHLRRAALLSEAMVRAGLDVTLVSGGLPVPGLRVSGVRLVQLPPVAAADMRFKSLVDAQGQPVDVQLQDARRDQLLALFKDLRPQALVIELFPFGRRQMRFELLPLLDAARTAQPAPVIVSSVRDVLGGSRDPERQDRMLAYFERYFDHLLVHGDPALLPFERTFAPADRIGTRLHYTGYVVAPLPEGASRGRRRRARSGRGAGVGWRRCRGARLAGGGHPRPTADGACRAALAGAGRRGDGAVGLRRAARAGAAMCGRWHHRRAQSARISRRLLGRCRLSVSQAGYNTVMETLQAGARAVMVPFAGGAETEQALRAQVLAEQHWIDIVEESRIDTPDPGAGHRPGGRSPASAARRRSSWTAPTPAPG